MKTILLTGAGELIALTIHAHPTLSETLMECADAYYGQATHVFTKKKAVV